MNCEWEILIQSALSENLPVNMRDVDTFVCARAWVVAGARSARQTINKTGVRNACRFLLSGVWGCAGIVIISAAH